MPTGQSARLRSWRDCSHGKGQSRKVPGEGRRAGVGALEHVSSPRSGLDAHVKLCRWEGDQRGVPAVFWWLGHPSGTARDPILGRAAPCMRGSLAR